MKWTGLLFIGMLFSTVFVWAYFPQEGEGKEKESMILNAVVNYLDALHFNPQDFDDEFSNKVFKGYLEAIDPSKRFLLQSEVDQLSIYQNEIDNQIQLRNFDFFDASLDIIDNSRKRAKTVFSEVIAEGLDGATTDKIEMDRDKRRYTESEAELKMLWKNLLKYDYNNRLRNKIEEQEQRIEKESEPDYEGEKTPTKTEAELKAEVVEKIETTYQDWFKRLTQDKRSDRFETYINSVTHLFDPHTDFYNPKEKQDFDIRMGGKLEGIGARLQTDGDYTKVTNIIPGGPAWKGKDLEVDDLITTVTQKDGEPLDITGMRIDDVVTHIRGKKGTVVILTVKKVDGSIQSIEIERDEVIIDEGFARSLTLDIPDVIENVGYIKLPKFYSSFEKKDGNSCAKDVAKEIEKLNDLNVNALILDLRNNGGGSLQDVVDMTGLFIEEGPIVQVKPRNKSAYLYDDKDPKVQFDKPMIVMVNQFSASASEILAAALQDYKRAIIVGSNSTFGKGTVQRFVDLDKAYRDLDELKPLGQLKITMQKFFRVNGGSTQLKGVTPDIIFPDNYHFIETGEKDYDHAMEWTEIDAVDYSQNVYHIPSVSSLNMKSQTRTGAQEDFQMVLENAARLKKNRDQTEYPLDFAAYNELMDLREEEAEQFSELFDNTVESLKMENLAVDLELINSDESRIARNDDWKEGISKDFYLEETMHILKDMINESNNAVAKK